MLGFYTNFYLLVAYVEKKKKKRKEEEMNERTTGIDEMILDNTLHYFQIFLLVGYGINKTKIKKEFQTVNMYK